jgi:hypothetical protein
MRNWECRKAAKNPGGLISFLIPVIARERASVNTHAPHGSRSTARRMWLRISSRVFRLFGSNGTIGEDRIPHPRGTIAKAAWNERL